MQGYLGHSSVDITLNIYTHVTEELKRDEIQKIADQFSAWWRPEKEEGSRNNKNGLLPALYFGVKSGVKGKRKTVACIENTRDIEY